MAKYIATIPDSGVMPLDRVVKRLNGTPDHPDLYFTALGTATDTGVETACGFARNSPLACVGDILTVATGRETRQYVILDTAGTLAEFYTSHNLNVDNLISGRLAEYIPNSGFQGDLPTAATAVKKGQEFRAGRKLVGSATTVMENDYLIAKKDFSLPASASLSTKEEVEAMLGNFVVVEQNLTGALVGISGTNNAVTLTRGKYIAKVEVDAGGKLKFTEGDLPVKGVSAVAAQSGKYLSGIALDASGNVTATTASLPTIPTVEYPTLHTLVFCAGGGGGENGAAKGPVSKDGGKLFVLLNGHPRYAPPVVAPVALHESLVVHVNGLLCNYREDYSIAGSSEETRVEFTDNFIQQIGLVAGDEISVTYLAHRAEVQKRGTDY